MISPPPSDWKDLQRQVSKIFLQSGLNAETNKKIKTTRGTVNVDVYAEDQSSQPPTIFICECKRWKSNVPKTVVHSLRTVVQDYGANWGFIISSKGFQSGAFKAAENSPIKLLTWNEFQQLYVDRWILNYMAQRFDEIYALLEYTEPINSRIIRKASKLDAEKKKKYNELYKKYQSLGVGLIPILSSKFFDISYRKFPLRENIHYSEKLKADLPNDLLDAIYLRDFVNIYCKHAQKAIAEFDSVFGERA